MALHASFLRYFHEVCKSGSIRLAARRLFVASSAVNRQILKVEAQLGVKLFERTRQGIRLTAAGRLLAGHIERTLADADRTLGEIAALRDSEGKLVTLAGQESVIAQFLPPVLVAFHAHCPEVSTVFKAAGGPQLLELLLAGQVDVALAFDPPPLEGMRRVAVCRLAVGAVMGPDHPLAGGARLSLADCTAYPLILPDRSWPLRALLDRLVAAGQLSPRVITTSNSVEFLSRMVDQQMGIGFQTIVGIEAKVAAGELVHVPLYNPQPVTQDFTLCLRNDPSSPVLEQLQMLLEQRLEDYRPVTG